jgi:hypothetical protein
MVKVNAELTHRDSANARDIKDSLGLENEAQAVSLALKLSEFLFRQVHDADAEICFVPTTPPKKLFGVTIPFTGAVNVESIERITMPEIEEARARGKSIRQSLSSTRKP